MLPNHSRPSVVWSKRDLRVSDHRPLAAAAERGPVMPPHIVEPEFWAGPDASHRHDIFLRQTALEPADDLAMRGAPLVVQIGAGVEVVSELHHRTAFSELWSHEETGNAWTFARDRAVGQCCRDHGVTWHEVAQTGVVRRLQSRNDWAKRWDRFMAKPLVSNTSPKEQLSFDLDVTGKP